MTTRKGPRWHDHLQFVPPFTTPNRRRSVDEKKRKKRKLAPDKPALEKLVNKKPKIFNGSGKLRARLRSKKKPVGSMRKRAEWNQRAVQELQEAEYRELFHQPPL